MVEFKFRRLDELTNWKIALRQPDAINYTIRLNDEEVTTFNNLSSLLELYRRIHDREGMEKIATPEIRRLDNETAEIVVRKGNTNFSADSPYEDLESELKELLANVFESLDRVSDAEKRRKAFERSEEHSDGMTLGDIYEKVKENS